MERKALLDEWGFRDLGRKEAEIRLQLRTNGGHRGMVSQETLIWLNEMKRVEDQMMKLHIHMADIERRGSCYSRSKVSRAKVKLDREVKSLLLNASSLLVPHGNIAIDRVAEQLVSPTLVGKSAQSVINQVCDYLTDPEIGIIGLYGEGGVGKTTIMKNINNILRNTDMFDKIIWVTLSKSATIETVQDQIAVQIGITLPSEVIPLVHNMTRPIVSRCDPPDYAKVRTRASVIIANLMNLEKCLFILDDMWDAVKLTNIGIPEQTTGNSYNYKVVLTTRSSRVCQQMGAHEEMHVSSLSENEAWDLFVSRSGDHVLDSEIEI